MIRRLSELMAMPLARPPGRRSGFARFVPEFLALAVYGSMLGVATWSASRHASAWLNGGRTWKALDGNDIVFGSTWAYALASAIIVLIPLSTMTATWISERSRATLDGLLLTPQDHGAVAVGRFLHLLLPWVRFMCWMLPLYSGLAGSGFFFEAGRHGSERLLVGSAAATGCKPLLATLLIEIGGGGSWSASGFVLAGLRWVTDLLGVLAMAALGCHVGARVRGVGSGLLIAWLIVPGLFIFPFSLHDWALLGLFLISEVFEMVHVSGNQVGLIYLPLALLSLTLEFVAAWWAVRGLARGFEGYALREKS
jgi:hypothetical protein